MIVGDYTLQWGIRIIQWDPMGGGIHMDSSTIMAPGKTPRHARAVPSFECLQRSCFRAAPQPPGDGNVLNLLALGGQKGPSKNGIQWAYFDIFEYLCEWMFSIRMDVQQASRALVT